ncbi:hypothetical protein [Canibacter zhoujuaniae]|uniref:hypothetical protein n=1 Tax=Canibacter zhoujuaniae TaxID=2708343 RepID=UPI0014201767|nr:hypothetical protein [Canibacter zhoujuaniae]
MSEFSFEHLPPSAADRDAAKRSELSVDDAVHAAEFEFVTRNLSVHEKVAVVAALHTLRSEESGRVRHRARIEREPWRRSQRKVRNMEDFNRLGER